MKTFLYKHHIDIIIAVLIFVVAAVPRLVDLGTFLTADEKNWIGRSYEFVRAFKDFRFNDMLQTSHPGVTTMWLTGVSVTAAMILRGIPFSFANISHFVSAAQLPIALVNAIAVPVMYLFLRVLFTPLKSPLPTGGSKGGSASFGISLTAALFIALNPFLIGQSRVAHVDALLASFLFLAVLALLIYAKRGYARSWLVTSAVFASLAVLTKVPAVFIIPFFALVILVTEKKQLFSKRILNERFRDFVIWGSIVALLFVIIWPAMLWVPDPEGNVLVLKRDLVIATVTPHHMTENYKLNSSHYPLTLLTRTTPIVLTFAIVTIVWLLLSKFPISQSSLGLRLAGNFQSRKGDPRTPTGLFGFPMKFKMPNVQHRETMWLLLGYVFFFILMMTLGAKKGDRYILPVFPALDVIAASGLVVTVSAMMSHFRIRNYELGIRRLIPYSLFLIPVVLLAWTVYSYHPYNISYSNPLFPDNLSQELGWGEGLEQVGAWLSLNDPDAIVASWYPEELGAYTSARVAHINAHEQGNVKYIVLYRNMFGRAPDHPANDFIDEYYKKREPTFTANIVGKEFAWVYEKKVYERVVGELVPNKRVGQLVEISHDNLAAVDVLIATYAGKAQSGNVIVDLKDSLDGNLMYQWRVPVSEIEDDMWHIFSLPQELQGIAGSVFIEIHAQGTREGDAPTIRYTRDNDYRKSQMILSDSGRLTTQDAKEGNLAIQLRYNIDGQLVSEDETKLLQ